MKLITFLQGKKTYFIFAALFILGGLQTVGVDIPEGWFVALAGLGGITLRAGVAKK